MVEREGSCRSDLPSSRPHPWAGSEMDFCAQGRRRELLGLAGLQSLLRQPGMILFRQKALQAGRGCPQRVWYSQDAHRSCGTHRIHCPQRGVVITGYTAHSECGTHKIHCPQRSVVLTGYNAHRSCATQGIHTGRCGTHRMHTGCTLSNAPHCEQYHTASREVRYSQDAVHTVRCISHGLHCTQ